MSDIWNSYLWLQFQYLLMQKEFSAINVNTKALVPEKAMQCKGGKKPIN